MGAKFSLQSSVRVFNIDDAQNFTVTVEIASGVNVFVLKLIMNVLTCGCFYLQVCLFAS